MSTVCHFSLNRLGGLALLPPLSDDAFHWLWITADCSGLASIDGKKEAEATRQYLDLTSHHRAENGTRHRFRKLRPPGKPHQIHEASTEVICRHQRPQPMFPMEKKVYVFLANSKFRKNNEKHYCTWSHGTTATFLSLVDFLRLRCKDSCTARKGKASCRMSTPPAAGNSKRILESGAVKTFGYSWDGFCVPIPNGFLIIFECLDSPDGFWIWNCWNYENIDQVSQLDAFLQRRPSHTFCCLDAGTCCARNCSRLDWSCSARS